MKISKREVCLTLAAMVFAMGCIPQWKTIEKPELTPKQANFKVTAPLGWVQLDGLEKVTFITKEGPGIQKIWIEQVHREKAFEALFKKKETKLEKDVLVTELAEYYIADFKMVSQGVQVTHKETLPALIDDKQGFKILMEYANTEGLIFEVVTYGFLHEDHLYTLTLHAPRLFFYDRDLPVFESMVDSFTLI